MADFFADPVALYWGLIITNGLWFFVVWSLRRTIGGKHFDSALKVVTKRIKHAARFYKLNKSHYIEVEFQDRTKPPNFYAGYTIPLTIDEGKAFNGESGFREIIVAEGALENIDPIQREQPFFNALQRLGETNNKMRDIEEARLRKKYDEELVTKKHFNLGIAVVVIGIVIVAGILYNMSGVVDGFQKTYEAYKPAIDNAIANLPHITSG